MSVKAFECIPVIETLQLQGEKAHTKIECVDCSGNVLYIGTSDGFIITHAVEERIHSSGRLSYSTKQIAHKCIDVRKPIKCMKAALAITRLLVLCNSNFYILNMSDLEVSGDRPKLKDVVTFCANESFHMNDTFSIQICVVRARRSLQIYTVSDDKMSLIRDVSLDEPIQEIAMNGFHICAALRTQYVIHNLQDDQTQMLFTYDNDRIVPVICSISKDEFLMNVEDVGMFATTMGISTRTPIQWSYPVISLAYFHPYVLGLSDEVIMVYSILDQQQKHTKQALPFAGGRCLVKCDSGLFVASGSSVYTLIPVPWQKQVEVLLADERVDEALNLAKNARPVDLSKEQFHRIYRKIQQQAAFIYFAKCDFDKARELFKCSKVDVREIISLYPAFLPLSSSFNRAVPPLHGIADVVQLYHGDKTKVKNAQNFLLHLLRDMRESGNSKHREEIDTALLKLYSELNPLELEAFIVAGEIQCDVADCSSWLTRKECYHALALLHRHAKDTEKALEVWSKIITGDYKDDNFHGLPFFVECLANLKEHDLVWRYADFVLGIDEVVGVGIFTLRDNDDSSTDTMKPDTIIDYLHKYPKGVILYLEHLVLKENIPMEKYHTHLAMLYLENIAKYKKIGEEENFNATRNKLRELLQQSNLYRIQLLLGKMQEANLPEETAILYGKLEEHRKALDILIGQLKDFSAAEKYCVTNSEGKDIRYRNNLFFTLLTTYLNPKLDPEVREEYMRPAMDLLNARPVDFDAVKVMEILPSNWSIAGLEPFLRGALRASMHRYRMSKLEAALARGENLQQQIALYETQKKKIVM
ncbi:Transforming growth factor-beta receptor-associated protein 1 [Gryllus bimaculatus]|nr:Transforming growth factor-beta receptor-associated protein 1 [Gryllus bimaculatus]